MDPGNIEITLSNPIVTARQLRNAKSTLDGYPREIENAARFVGACLTQVAGVLLRVPQDVTAKAVVIFTRFWVGPNGGSLKEHDTADISAACLYLTAKSSATPLSPRSIINVYAYLEAHPPTSPASLSNAVSRPKASTYYVSEGTYMTRRDRLHSHELIILQTLGFATSVALPHSICITYLQTLDVLSATADTAAKELGRAVAARAWAHLNSALLSPQQLYLTKQPHVLATAAIYLAARELGWKLPEEEWWVLFDTDREDLGFVVVALMSLEGWVRTAYETWGSLQTDDDGRTVDRGIWDMLTVDGVERALQKQRDAWDLDEAENMPNASI